MTTALNLVALVNVTVADALDAARAADLPGATFRGEIRYVAFDGHEGAYPCVSLFELVETLTNFHFYSPGVERVTIRARAQTSAAVAK